MSRGLLFAAPAFLLLASGCTNNTAPGNDREAELSPSEPAAEVMAAGAAIHGVANSLLVPQIMTEADLENVPEAGETCFFRMTRVGLPVLVYGSDAAIKLNDKLVMLPAAGARRYAADGVTVTVRPLDEDAAAGGRFAAEFVLRLPGTATELGYHGFSEC